MKSTFKKCAEEIKAKQEMLMVTIGSMYHDAFNHR